MMETQVGVTIETFILQTSHEEFRIFKVGICFAYFVITFAVLHTKLGLGITFAALQAAKDIKISSVSAYWLWSVPISCMTHCTAKYAHYSC